ncbi:hypothetical protein PV08_06927 [Exophiala spinifera]|uniref:RRM domain-containing protein n=1 Tax=Exophiala spinifera TaxID=91928 RepID=A0A0D1YGM7_9EURO|nr:uncharacterized protein PV08_06927 [Exophiala spinifera]KIW14146.1 hypothetical protein PV08_06927 [Exophiala spinifera]
MPHLPLPPPSARSRASSPPSPSSGRDVGALDTEMGFLSVGNTTTRPGSSSATSTLTGAAIAPSQEDDVFAYVPPSGPAALRAVSGHVPQRISPSFRAPNAFGNFEPRPDRVLQTPNARNAQGMFPPEALIFVANLSSGRTIDQLEQSCHEAFDKFGACHIFIKYDPRQHPFAFVQFENIDDANQAMSYTTDLELDGRKIRLERGKADRAVILSKKDGSPMTEAEARGVLEPYGRIELCIPADSRHLSISGMYIKFAFYLDCRDALKGHNNAKSPFTVVLAPAMEPRFHLGPDGLPKVRGFASPRSLMDAKSIFVGNLPEYATRHEVESLFQEYGSILQTNIIKKTFADGGINVFAFIEFAHPHEADRASLADHDLHGHKLRIEPKEYSSRRASRVNNENLIVHAPRYNYAGTMNKGQVYDHIASSSARQVYASTTSAPYPPPAPTLYNAQPVFNPMTQMVTPPHHNYGTHNSHAYGHGPQNNIAGMPAGPAPPSYQTPPSSSNYAQHMLPPGMFSPTPPGNNYGCGPWFANSSRYAGRERYPNEGTYYR